ncbi:class I SAM-dependent methyltransferase [bacterium]|nr:class I SAM-dependent methyltransferase [bacterium]
MKQKKVFLEKEGDAWFERNHSALQKQKFDLQDPVISAIHRCINADLSQKKNKVALLEIGCGEGKRLKYLSKKFNISCQGIEPSQKAVAMAIGNKLSVVQGTADSLPYDCQIFDIVVFGFCLYLCDREHLFQIAHEADRVLKKSGWIVIHDFFSTKPSSNEYHHFSGLYAYKMDYRKLFDWHPDYTCFSHEVIKHAGNGYTDDPNEWVAISVLRKRALN